MDSTQKIEKKGRRWFKSLSSIQKAYWMSEYQRWEYIVDFNYSSKEDMGKFFKWLKKQL